MLCLGQEMSDPLLKKKMRGLRVMTGLAVEKFELTGLVEEIGELIGSIEVMVELFGPTYFFEE